MRRILRINLGLSILCLLAGGAVYESAARAASDRVLAKPSLDVVERPAPAIVRLDRENLAAFREIAARPLFSPDRRPAARVVKKEPSKPEAMPYVMLTGIAQMGERRVVISQNRDGSQSLVALGEPIEGWTLAEIRDGHAVLVRGERRLVAEMGVEHLGGGKAATARVRGTAETQNGKPRRVRRTDMTHVVDED